MFRRAVAPHHRHHEATRRCQGDPSPGIAVGFAPPLGGCQGVLLGMNHAPSFLQVTFSHRQVRPRGQPDQPAVVGSPVQPGTHGILIELDTPRGPGEGIPRGQRPPRPFENGRSRFKVKRRGSVAQGDSPSTRTTPGLGFPVAGPLLDQPPLTKGTTIIATSAMGTLERLPVHGSLGKLTTPC